MSSPDRPSVLARFGDALFDAEKSGRRITRLSDRLPDLTEVEAYAIAAVNIARRTSPPAGYKLGYTSAAMQRQMNISHPNFGVLTHDRVVGPGLAQLALQGLVHPRVEPELTLRLGRDLAGADCTPDIVAQAVDCVYPSVEVVDTRYEDYVFKAVDNIADNSSSALCVLGAPQSLQSGSHLARCEVQLEIDGAVLANGSGSDAMGDPLEATAWLVRTLALSERGLRAGDLVMTGGLTKAFAVRAGQRLVARFRGFEPLGFQCA